MHLQPGTFLQGGKYKIVRFIKSGGFGCTYEARHTVFDERVAIKEFFPKDFCNRESDKFRVTVGTENKKPLVSKLKRKFIDEAVALRKLPHPGIVSVSDVFEENGTAYYVMDYIDGCSLDDLVRRDGALSEHKSLSYIREVSSALAYVHSRNRLHLDIKPGNIMVDNEGHVILIDFGASKQYDEENGENTSTLLGLTPGYAPLEQYKKGGVSQFSAATDIYSLGASLYRLLTGQTPPEASEVNEDGLPALPLSLSSSVRNAVEQAMSPRRKDRPQSVREFLNLLDIPVLTVVDEDTKVQDQNTASGEPERAASTKSETSVASSVSEIKGSPRGMKWILGLIVALVIVVILFFVSRDLLSALVPDEKVVEYHRSKSEISYTNGVLRVKGVEYPMVYVSGGSFDMGATSEQVSNVYDREKPIHRVTLGSYRIGKYEVTQELWEAVMGSNPSRFKGARRPVDYVSWNDCIAFIRKLNKLTGEKFRLPTEAEWEFAARGGNGNRPYKYSGNNTIDDVAWYSGNSEEKTHDVGLKSPNALGLYDMSGNVYEWCWDKYGSYSSFSQTNPKGPNCGTQRVFRGGSWNNDASRCRVFYRSKGEPGCRGNYLGLRLCH